MDSFPAQFREFRYYIDGNPPPAIPFLVDNLLLAVYILEWSHLEIEIKTHRDISSYIVHETAIFKVPVKKLRVQGKLINANYLLHRSSVLQILCR
jgi:hypothetical protein